MTPSSSTARRYRENWQEEIDSAAQYRALAEQEDRGGNAKIAEVYRSLAATEEAHVVFWEEQLRRTGHTPGPRQPSWRSRLLVFIASKLGTQAVLPTLAASEHSARDNYSKQPETERTRMARQERWHARVLRTLVRQRPDGVEGSFLGKLEGRHRAVGGNALRAAVLGANDGLCSNLSLVMGVAGAAVNEHALLVSGLAGMMAGAFSMALGEFVSVLSARELAEREIRIEREELELDPQAEGDELRLIYEAKGLPPAEAKAMAEHLLADPARALDALTREELGIDPDDLGGSPWEAALVSFFLFSIGAIVPVAPLLFLHGHSAIFASVAASGAALFGIGALITVFTGRPAWRSGLRQLVLGLSAAAVTFALGRLVGGSIGG